MAAEEGKVEEPEQRDPFHLDLHAYIESQQTAHGVRHDDYGQYHAYCTRRLARLSHLPEAKKYLVCSSKFATEKQKGGGRHAFCSRQPDTFSPGASVENINVLWYLLVLSERSWAHANQLQKQKKRRQQVLKKLKKAQKWAQLLLQMASGDCTDATTYQECQAYASWMTANFALEKLDYKTASEEYAKAMSLCHELGRLQDNTTKDDAKRLERQDLFMTRADTVLRPLFRYCQYELKQAGQELTVEEPRWKTTEDDVQSANASESETSITFRGHELVLESKELRVLMLKLQSQEKQTEDETSFLSALSVLDDALEVVQANLSSLEQAQMGPAVQAKRQQWQLWQGYLKSQKTQRVMDHTSELLRGITGHAERVHLYESLLQMAKSLLELPHPEEEEEDEFALQAQANILRLRALKTYHMAWYYYQQASNYSKALALVDQSQRLSKSAQEEIAACDEDMPHADEYLQELEELPIPSAKAAMKAALYLQKGGKGSTLTAQSTKRPLLWRLDDDDAGLVMADDMLPIPIPCKPVFYDLAYDYAMDGTEALDALQMYVQEHTVEQSEPEDGETDQKGGSLLGWFTSSDVTWLKNN